MGEVYLSWDEEYLACQRLFCLKYSVGEGIRKGTVPENRPLAHHILLSNLEIKLCGSSNVWVRVRFTARVKRMQ